MFDGQGGYFCEEDPPECVGYGGIDADEREGCVVGLVLVEDDLEILGKVSERPGVVFTRVVAWKVG